MSPEEAVAPDQARHAASNMIGASQTIPTASGSSPPLGLLTELPTNVPQAILNEIARVAVPLLPQ